MSNLFDSILNSIKSMKFNNLIGQKIGTMIISMYFGDHEVGFIKD